MKLLLTHYCPIGFYESVDFTADPNRSSIVQLVEDLSCLIL